MVKAEDSRRRIPILTGEITDTADLGETSSSTQLYALGYNQNIWVGVCHTAHEISLAPRYTKDTDINTLNENPVG